MGVISQDVRSGSKPDRNLALELVRVTEAAALAAARWVGRGEKEEADGAAVDAMRLLMNTVPIDGVAGLPIVGTTVGGVPEFVRHGEHGLLVPPRDPGALAAAIEQLGGDPERRRDIAARNRAHAESHLSWDAVTRRYLAVYAEVGRARAVDPVRVPLAVVP